MQSKGNHVRRDSITFKGRGEMELERMVLPASVSVTG
jgi:hypothetical protein